MQATLEQHTSEVRRRLAELEERERDLYARETVMTALERKVGRGGTSVRVHDASASSASPHRVTVDVVGNAASNVFRGLLVARQQAGEELDALSAAPGVDPSLLAALQREYDDLGDVLDSKRALLFDLHARVQGAVAVLDKSGGSLGEEDVGVPLAQEELEALLTSLLALQHQQAQWEDKLRSLAPSDTQYSLLDEPGPGNESEGSLYDTPVGRRWHPPVSQPSTGRSDWLHQLGIPVTPGK